MSELTCKVDGCTNDLRYSGLRLCNKHYVRNLKTGTFERSDNKAFNGSTYKTSKNRNAISEEDRLIRDKFMVDRDEDVVKRMFKLRDKYEKVGIYVKTADLRRELENTIDISATTIERIIRLSGLAPLLKPTEGLIPLETEEEVAVPMVVVPDDSYRKFHTMAW